MDFTNKNELNLVKRTAKIFTKLYTDEDNWGKAELSLDNNTHAEICLGVEIFSI